MLALAPDASRHPGVWTIGVLGPLASGGFEVRALKFADGMLREDPVTGSLNAAAAEWLVAHQLAEATFCNRQGTVLGRRGRVQFRQEDGILWTGGATHVLIDGHIEL